MKAMVPKQLSPKESRLLGYVLFACVLGVSSVAQESKATSLGNAAGIALTSSANQDSKDPSAHPGTPDSRQVDDDYVIGPSDVLGISVWKDTELTQKSVLVRPDGKITIPLVGELTVSGLTPPAVQRLISQKLKEYISNPQVAVIVEEVKSRTYVIVGKVAKPGSYGLGKPTTVLEAIAIAGGPQDFAKTKKIYIIRRMGNGSTTRLPFDYNDIIKGHHPEQNIDLQSGDTVVVP